MCRPAAAIRPGRSPIPKVAKLSMRLVLIAVALLTIIGAVVLLLFSEPEVPADEPVAAERARPDVGGGSQPASAGPPSGTKPAEPVATDTVEQRRTVLVDSYPAEAQGDVADWRQLDANTGYLDVAIVQDVGRRLAERDTVWARDVLVVSGWAGDTWLGMHLHDVVLTMCGKIVARGQVNGPRPDVAKAVHRNLERSGWRITVLAADLPDCDSPILGASAVVPGQIPALVALNGSLQLTVVGRGGDMPDRASQQPDITPQTYEKPRPVQVEITGSRVNMRRCGSTACEVVGQVDEGEYPAFVVGKDGDWSLLLVGDRSGWVYDPLFEVRR